MNMIIRIALSVLLIASVAQPMQAASHADRAKKVAMVAVHSLQVLTGLALLEYSLGIFDHARRPDQCLSFPGRIANATFAALCLYFGIGGLKDELSPRDAKPRT